MTVVRFMGSRMKYPKLIGYLLLPYSFLAVADVSAGGLCGKCKEVGRQEVVKSVRIVDAIGRETYKNTYKNVVTGCHYNEKSIAFGSVDFETFCETAEQKQARAVKKQEEELVRVMAEMQKSNQLGQQAADAVPPRTEPVLEEKGCSSLDDGLIAATFSKPDGKGGLKILTLYVCSYECRNSIILRGEMTPPQVKVGSDLALAVSREIDCKELREVSCKPTCANEVKAREVWKKTMSERLQADDATRKNLEQIQYSGRKTKELKEYDGVQPANSGGSSGSQSGTIEQK